jgi:hypothetical protein
MGNYLHGRHSSSGDARLAGSVSVRDLVKRYDSVIAVAGECSEVRSDEFLALLGPSGSGKTTILMNIAGFDFPDSGSIEIGGCDATWMSPDKRELGMAFQRYTLFPRMSGSRQHRLSPQPGPPFARCVSTASATAPRPKASSGSVVDEGRQRDAGIARRGRSHEHALFWPRGAAGQEPLAKSGDFDFTDPGDGAGRKDRPLACQL